MKVSTSSRELAWKRRWSPVVAVVPATSQRTAGESRAPQADGLDLGVVLLLVHELGDPDETERAEDGVVEGDRRREVGRGDRDEIEPGRA